MEIYEINDICEILKIGKSTAYDLVRSGELPSFKIHGVWKITNDSLNEFLKKQTITQKTKDSMAN